MKKKKELTKILEEVVYLSTQNRPEVEWLQEIYERFMTEKNVIKKADGDIKLYELMYSCKPSKSSEIIKIRFWRTGQHLPVDRKQMDMFANALGMSEEEKMFFTQAFMDKSDRVFMDTDKMSDIYIARRKVIQTLVDEYLVKVHPLRKIALGITDSNMEGSIRHIYYNDALELIHSEIGDNKKGKRFESISYGSEFLKSIRLEGEIPRKTILRHILIMCMPYINKRVVDELLTSLGYIGLTDNHTLTGGERLDLLIIRFLELYRECCDGMEPEECNEWLREALVYIDYYMKKEKLENLRPIHFKALVKD